MKTLSIQQPWAEMIDRQQNWLVTFNDPDLIAEIFPPHDLVGNPAPASLQLVGTPSLSYHPNPIKKIPNPKNSP